jgi:hypothetical protein
LVGVLVGAGVSVGGMGVGVEVAASVHVGLLSRSSVGVALGETLPVWHALTKKLKSIKSKRLFFIVIFLMTWFSGHSGGYHTALERL